MRYRTFGRLGWQVSEIGFGAWAIGGSWGAQSEDDSVRALHRALDLGCNFLDTAQGYGGGKSERIIGRVLKERTGENVYVATKIPPAPGDWPPSPYDRIEDRYPAQYLRQQVEEALGRLQTEAIDLMQLHTWTRAWNRNPVALETLRTLQKEGKILGIGVSTPEQDQNSLIDLMRAGWLDSVQVIYNIFEQEPAAEFFPVAEEQNVGVIVRVALEESALTGKLTLETKFGEDDFRSHYFRGDRLARTVAKVAKLQEAIGTREPDLVTAALKFAVKPTAVSTVIAGMRNARQAEQNCGVGDLPPLSAELEQILRKQGWPRGCWHKS